VLDYTLQSHVILSGGNEYYLLVTECGRLYLQAECLYVRVDVARRLIILFSIVTRLGRAKNMHVRCRNYTLHMLVNEYIPTMKTSGIWVKHCQWIRSEWNGC
jgi:hypothetical protein